MIYQNRDYSCGWQVRIDWWWALIQAVIQRPQSISTRYCPQGCFSFTQLGNCALRVNIQRHRKEKTQGLGEELIHYFHYILLVIAVTEPRQIWGHVVVAYTLMAGVSVNLWLSCFQNWPSGLSLLTFYNIRHTLTSSQDP